MKPGKRHIHDAQRDVSIGGDVVGRDKIAATGRGIVIGKLNIPVMPLVAALGLGLMALALIGFMSTRTQLQVQ